MSGMRRKTRHLTLALLLAVLLAGAARPAPVAAQADELIARVNALRASLGLHPYTPNGALNAAAQSHANWMATTKQVSHNQPGGSTPRTRANAAGYPGQWVTENIYGGTRASLEGAWNFWVNSSIHYRGLTNANYYDIGVGIASADGWTFYVLKFGNASGSWGSSTGGTTGGGGGGGGGASVARAPTFIVGWDNYGNIMHEIQEGQTAGDIALTYGYGWADIPALLTLNEMTEDDLRRLPIGGIFLVPPKGGTYTPTPYPEGYSTPTPNAEQAVETAIAVAIARETSAPATQRAAILLTPIFSPTPREDTSPTPTPSPTEPPRRVATSAGVPVALQPTTDPAAIRPTTTPEPPIAAVALLPDAPTPPPENTPASPPRATGRTPWLGVAVAVQALILFIASAEFFRRSRRAKRR